jgi:hypothetical protein
MQRKIHDAVRRRISFAVHQIRICVHTSAHNAGCSDERSRTDWPILNLLTIMAQ